MLCFYIVSSNCQAFDPSSCFVCFTVSIILVFVILYLWSLLLASACWKEKSLCQIVKKNKIRWHIVYHVQNNVYRVKVNTMWETHINYLSFNRWSLSLLNFTYFLLGCQKNTNVCLTFTHTTQTLTFHIGVNRLHFSKLKIDLFLLIMLNFTY